MLTIHPKEEVHQTIIWYWIVEVRRRGNLRKPVLPLNEIFPNKS